MSTRKTTVILSVLVLVFGATTVWLWRALEQERSDLAKIEVAQSPKSYASGVPSPAPVESTPAPAVEQDGHEYFEKSRFKRGLIFSGDDPRLRQIEAYMVARRRYLEASFAERYPDLVRELKVPKETALRIVELSPEEQRRWSGVKIEAKDQRSFWLEQQQRAYEGDVEIAALVGDAKLQQWKDYQASIWERHQVRQLRLELMDSAEPLGGETAESLIRALYEERQRIEQDARAMSGSTPGDEHEGPAFIQGQDAVESQAELERRTLKAAGKVLSSYQFEAFRQMLERQQTAESAMDEMHRIGMETLK